MTQLSLLSGMDTPAKSSENAPPKDGSPTCQCGKGMSDCSIHPSTPEKWIASMRDSLARTLALPGIKRALDMRHDPAYIEKSSVLLASFDRDTCSLKTCQQSLVTDSEPYSQTLPRWGSLRSGDVSEHPIAAHRINETDGFCLPTPQASDNRSRGYISMPSVKRRILIGKQNGLSTMFKGAPCPMCVEGMMGFPPAFTASKGWGTPRSRCKPPLPISYLEANK